MLSLAVAQHKSKLTCMHVLHYKIDSGFCALAAAIILELTCLRKAPINQTGYREAINPTGYTFLAKCALYQKAFGTHLLSFGRIYQYFYDT